MKITGSIMTEAPIGFLSVKINEKKARKQKSKKTRKQENKKTRKHQSIEAKKQICFYA